VTATQHSAPVDRQHLITSCQGLVRSIAWKVHQRLPAHVDLDDLVSYGQVGLAEAARDFDSGRGGQFTTYAWYRVRGAILDGLSRMRWFNRGDFEAGRYERMAHETLADANSGGGDPSLSPSEEIDRQGGWLKGMSSVLAVACIGSWCGSGTQDEIADSGIEPPDRIVMRREIAAILRDAVAALPSDMAALVRLTYFEGHTLTSAAETVGISKAWASRLHTRALGQLATALQRVDLHK
jgi:RNA polymerase sigma factor for flagellar operon FliA